MGRQTYWDGGWGHHKSTNQKKTKCHPCFRTYMFISVTLDTFQCRNFTNSEIIFILFLSSIQFHHFFSTAFYNNLHSLVQVKIFSFFVCTHTLHFTHHHTNLTQRQPNLTWEIFLGRKIEFDLPIFLVSFIFGTEYLMFLSESSLKFLFCLIIN